MTEIALREKWDMQDRVTGFGMMEIASPLSLHHIAGLPPILGQGTPEQIEAFAKPAMQNRFLLCYAQTELGHGSNVQQLEVCIFNFAESVSDHGC